MNSAHPEQVRPIPNDNLTANAVLMAKAREILKGKWGFGVLVALIYCLISVIPSSIKDGIGGLIGLIINGPISLGLAILFLNLVRSGNAKLDQMFEGFNRFGVAFVTYLLMVLYIILWTLLFIVPGIIAAFGYSMTFFILADSPGISASDALAKSKQIMMGNKKKLFCLCCRFIGWGFLCLLSAGIGFLWLMPYAYTSMTLFYEDIKQQ
jgi:uncharacterized membrane protein